MILSTWPLPVLTREMLEWYCKHWDFKATFKLVNSNVSGNIPRTRTKLFIQSTAKLFSGMNLAHSSSFFPWMDCDHSMGQGAMCMKLSLFERINEFICMYVSTCWPWCLLLSAFYLPGEVEPKHLELSTQANNFLWRITLISGKCCTWQGPKLATITHSKSWCICKIRLPVTIWISISWIWMVQKLSIIKPGSSAEN